MGNTKRQIGIMLMLFVLWSGLSGTSTAQDRKAQLAEAEHLGQQALDLYAAGRYADAIQLAERTLMIREKVLGPEHRDVAKSLNNLAAMYMEQDDQRRALPFLQRALRIDQKLLGDQHPNVANDFGNLAVVYHAQGYYDRAMPFYKRALDIQTKVFGRNHSSVAVTLNNLAALYQDQGDYERALPLYKRTLKIDVKMLGSMHPGVAIGLNNLALVYQKQGDYKHALPLYKRALKIDEKMLGGEHPDMAIFLDNLATLYYAQGDYARALPLYQRALTIREKALSSEHPGVAKILNHLARLYRAQGDYAQAISINQQAAKVREKNIGVFLDTGSQQQKQSYLDTLSDETNDVISLHTQDMPQNADAARLAITIILQRKGRALDAFTGQLSALRQRAAQEDQALIDQLAAARSKYIKLILNGQGNNPEVKQMEDEEEHLEDAISRSSAEFRAIAQPVTLEAITAALPQDAALVEVYVYNPFNARAKGTEKRYGAPHYVAYVLQRSDDVPQFTDLGETAVIDAEVERLREALKDPNRVDIQAIARDLDELVMHPIRQLLGSTRLLFLSPDGALNLIPFAALVDENGKYLVENYSLIYLTSGRDLLRLHDQSESRSVPIVLANPLYDLTAGQQDNQPLTSSEINQRSLDFTPQHYLPLPGTASEAMALAKLWPDAQVLTQEEATEGAVKRVINPRILHIATHGFFLTDKPQKLSIGNRSGRETIDTLTLSNQPHLLMRRENPMLRSGLILAGVEQQHNDAEDDGVLTALETAALNLWSTKLVVLSACETGLGEVRNGEGIYGLRRALVLAGSQTQVMSLWKVSDTGTCDLMVAYYKRLQAGEGRTEALRQVQLEMLHGEFKPKRNGADYQHPYYWAAFISSGDWRSLDSKINGIVETKGPSGWEICLLIIGLLSIFSLLCVWWVMTKKTKPTPFE